MMWIVRLALRRPYTFVVFALLILILGVLSIETMPTDIFPNIDIPVVTVVWQFTGLSADQIANRIVTQRRAGHDHDCQRHRSHRVAIAGGRRDHQNLLSPQCEHRPGRCPGDRHQPSAVAIAAAGHQSAIHHPVQRLQRSRAATGTFRARPQRAAAERPGHADHSHSTGHRSRERNRPIPTAANSARS